MNEAFGAASGLFWFAETSRLREPVGTLAVCV
jgi:hypothetical protein